MNKKTIRHLIGNLSTVLGLGLAAFPCRAHVKWFSEPTGETAARLPDTSVLILAAIALLVGLWLAKMVDGLVQRFALTPRRLYSRSTRPLRLAYYLIAVYFLGAALTSTFLVPHIRVEGWLLTLGVGVQLVIYSGLLLDRGRVLCALLIAALFVVAGAHNPLFVLEYPLLLALAWIVLFADDRPSEVGLFLVRTLLAVSLISLAFTEKLNDPGRALAMLEHYDFNFMTALGFDYSDRLFVYSAGLVELLLGLVLLTGWVTRLAVGALFGFMVATNSYFFMLGEYQLAWVELVGHLPIFACGLLLLFYQPTAVPERPGAVTPVGRAKVSAALGRPH